MYRKSDKVWATVVYVFYEKDLLKQEIDSLRTEIEIERMESEVLFWRQKVDLYEKEKFSYERFKESNKNIRFNASFPSSEVLEHCFNFLNPGSHWENMMYWQSALQADKGQTNCVEEDMSEEVKREFNARKSKNTWY